MDRDIERKIRAIEHAREIADIENINGKQIAQSIEMNEEIEEKLALVKSLKSKLRFFRGIALAEVVLLIIILLYSCGFFEKEEEPPVEEVIVAEDNVPVEYDIHLEINKPDFSLEGIRVYSPADLLGSVDSDFVALSDDCGGAYSYDDGELYYITGEETKSEAELPETSLYRVDDIADRWAGLTSDYSISGDASDISFVHSDTKYTYNAWQLYSYEDIEYDTGTYWSADINLPAISQNLIISSLGVVSFRLSISGQDIDEISAGLENLFDGLGYGKVEKNGEVISYTVNTPSVQADMLFYGGSGVELPEGWKIGYDADADIIVTVHVGGTYYAPEALLGGVVNG
ncbi:MAG: hypothetical protein K2M91_00785 [Lachnospiraceae bacterium]|nr:hypothetical protein [Lachnospiraceae bacterium]